MPYPVHVELYDCSQWHRERRIGRSEWVRRNQWFTSSSPWGFSTIWLRFLSVVVLSQCRCCSRHVQGCNIESSDYPLRWGEVVTFPNAFKFANSRGKDQKVTERTLSWPSMCELSPLHIRQHTSISPLLGEWRKKGGNRQTKKKKANANAVMQIIPIVWEPRALPKNPAARCQLMQMDDRRTLNTALKAPALNSRNWNIYSSITVGYCSKQKNNFGPVNIHNKFILHFF